MVAHESQLHPVPDAMSDEAAVMVEPTACAVHAARSPAGVSDGDVVVVIGAGTLGLLHHRRPPALHAGGHHAGRRGQAPRAAPVAADLGADVVCEPAELGRVVRRLTGAHGATATTSSPAAPTPSSTASGSDDSIAESLAIVRPRGRVVLVGMPAAVTLDLTTLWHRETQLRRRLRLRHRDVADGGRTRTFDLAFELVQDADLEPPASRPRTPSTATATPSSTPPTAGRRGAVKIAFDLRNEKENR